MKKLIYTLILMLLVVGGFVFANRKSSNEPANKPTTKPPVAAEMNAELKQWEATPEGVYYKEWQASPAGKKVQASVAKISKPIKEFTDMEAVVSALSLPPGSRLGFGVMVRIDGDEYILAFGPENNDQNHLNGNHEFQSLHRLKVNDQIIIRSHSVLHAPKYLYPIVMGDYVEHANKVIYKRIPRKGGC